MVRELDPAYHNENWAQQKKEMSYQVMENIKETLMYRSVLWTLWERERVGRFGRMTLKHV